MCSDKKKAFLVYCDNMEHIKLLDDKDCGRLFRALLRYAVSGETTELDGMAKMAFSFMKLQMDRDQEKYEEQCAKNQRNGAKGGRPRKYQEPKEQPLNEAGEPENIFLPEETQRFFEKPKKPDTDTVTETKTETETNTDTATDTATDTNTDIDIDIDTVSKLSAFTEEVPKEKNAAITLSSCEEMRSGSINKEDDNIFSEKRKKDSECCPFAKIMELYNTICRSYSRITAISGKRRRNLSILWKQHPSLDEFTEAFKRAERSAFLRSKQWAGFDWMINQDRFINIIEGRYDNAKPKQQDSHHSYSLDRWENETLGVEWTDEQKELLEAFNV